MPRKKTTANKPTSTKAPAPASAPTKAPAPEVLLVRDQAQTLPPATTIDQELMHLVIVELRGIRQRLDALGPKSEE